MSTLDDRETFNLPIVGAASGGDFGKRVSKAIRSLQIVKMQISTRLQYPEGVGEEGLGHRRQRHDNPVKALAQDGYDRAGVTKIQDNITKFFVELQILQSIPMGFRILFYADNYLGEAEPRDS